jgi:hypothetical protein
MNTHENRSNEIGKGHGDVAVAADCAAALTSTTVVISKTLAVGNEKNGYSVIPRCNGQRRCNTEMEKLSASSYRAT